MGINRTVHTDAGYYLMGSGRSPAIIICALFALLVIGSGDDRSLMPSTPPPEIIDKAATAVNGLAFDLLDDHMLFLSDWWPVQINNSSMINITA